MGDLAVDVACNLRLVQQMVRDFTLIIHSFEIIVVGAISLEWTYPCWIGEERVDYAR